MQYVVRDYNKERAAFEQLERDFADFKLSIVPLLESLRKGSFPPARARTHAPLH